MQQKQPMVAYEWLFRFGPLILHGLFALTLVAGIVLKLAGMLDSTVFRLCAYVGLLLLVLLMRVRQLSQLQSIARVVVEILIICGITTIIAIILFVLL